MITEIGALPVKAKKRKRQYHPVCLICQGKCKQWDNVTIDRCLQFTSKDGTVRKYYRKG